MARLRMPWFEEAWMGSMGPDFAALWRLAEEQDGFFTNAEARSCGFRRSLLSRHSVAGRFCGPFVRIRRGIYRMRDYPARPTDLIRIEWMAAGRRWTVVSHRSALFLHDLVDPAPSPIDLTLPRSRRWYAPAREDPRYHRLRIHLPLMFPAEAEITTRRGIRVTAVERSLVDAVDVGILQEELAEALRRAIERDALDLSSIRRRALERSARVERSLDSAIAELQRRR